MKHIARLVLTIAGFSLAADAANAADPSVDTFVGCWLTPEPAPIVILGGDKPGDYQVFHEEMLLFVERIDDTELVKGRYYAFSPDLKSVIGPAYVDGAFNPAEGVLTVGEPKGGLNRVHAMARDRLLYVHTKAADTADMSVRDMARMECAAAEAREAELKAAQKSDG